MTVRTPRRVGWLAAAVALLVAFALARRLFVPGDRHFAANVVAALALAGFARLAGLSAAELGLARDRVEPGLRWGGLALAAVAGVATVGLLLVGPEPFVEDERLAVSAGEMLYRALVRIPLGTVVLEELAFRGILFALLWRRLDTSGAIVASAALFSLWHIPPVLGAAGDAAGALAGELAGTLVATFVAGVAFAWLRARSGSLLAPVLAHVGTNSAVFALAWSFA